MSLPQRKLLLKATKSDIESSKVNKTQFNNYEAHLLAKGFFQIAGVNYSNTCFPDPMRTMFAITEDGNYYVGLEIIHPK